VIDAEQILLHGCSSSASDLAAVAVWPVPYWPFTSYTEPTAIDRQPVARLVKNGASWLFIALLLAPDIGTAATPRKI
jgi:hypothetical protein